ncbi:MAG: hypothetical protein HXY21_04935 [Parvularculaceae bacterium]|nr:hypothetical protein [Parvularculaceae bacterium]
MKSLLIGAAALGAAGVGAATLAESFEDMCMRVSDEWGTQGDVAGQCACLAAKAAGDPALDSELRSLADAYSSDQEAYDAASDGTKAALDACSVNS